MKWDECSTTNLLINLMVSFYFSNSFHSYATKLMDFVLCLFSSLSSLDILVLNSFNQSPRDDFNVMADRYCFIHWWFHLFNGETWHIYYSYVICPLLWLQCWQSVITVSGYDFATKLYIFFMDTKIQNQFCSFTYIFMFTFTQNWQWALG